jgi:hypothetical protein
MSAAGARAGALRWEGWGSGGGEGLGAPAFPSGVVLLLPRAG